MKQNRIAAPDVFLSHKRASAILAQNGNRLVLVEAIVLLIMAIALHFLLTDSFVLLADFADSEQMEWLVTAAMLGMVLVLALLTVFVTLPLFIGFLRLAAEAEATGTGHLTTLFSSFSGWRIYRRSLRLAWGFFVWCLLLTAVISTTCALTVGLFPGNILAGILCGFAVVAEIALFLLLMMRAFPTLAIAFDLRFSMRDTKRLMRSMRSRMSVSGWKFFLSWLPMLMLGGLTFGLLLIWDTLPRMAISYFSHVRKMNEMIIQSEENKEHE